MNQIELDKKVVYRRKLKKYLLIDSIIGIFSFIIILLYSANYSFLGAMDAVAVSGILLFAVGWFILVSNFGLFDLTIYGLKSFPKGIMGKKPKKTIEEALYNKDKIPAVIYHAIWYASLIQIIIAAGLYVIYYNFL